MAQKTPFISRALGGFPFQTQNISVRNFEHVRRAKWDFTFRFLPSPLHQEGFGSNGLKLKQLSLQ